MYQIWLSLAERLRRITMLFSRASRDSRVRHLGLMRGKDENQVQLRARLAKLAKGPVEEVADGKFSRAASVEEETVKAKRRGMVVLSRREQAGRGAHDISAHHISATQEDPDFNPRTHPLWHPGAEPEWFRAIHTDRHGKAWCLADAGAVMQAGARGFLSRRRRRLLLQVGQRVFQSVYATKIQRTWRVARARRARKSAIGNMVEFKGGVLKRCARAMTTRNRWGLEYEELEVAARRIQRKFRGGRMKLVIRRLMNQKLTAAVVCVQRGWSEYKRWIAYHRMQEDLVYEAAEDFKRHFMAALKDPHLSAKEVRERRQHSLDQFMQKTNVIGRRNVFKTLKQQQMGGEFAKVEFKLKDAMKVSTEQVLELNGRPKDAKHTDLKIQECFYKQKTALDLSTDPCREGQEELKIGRWPYGLQGDHGMFRLTQLVISYNNLLGLPLDFYRLTNLTDLRANHNRIKILSPEISRLQALQIVWIHYNLLIELPAATGGLTKLDQLAINNNQLVSLPTTMGFLTQMSQLRLDANPFQSPPVEILRTIVKPPEVWDFSIVLRYLRHLHTAHTPSVEVHGFGINNVPTVLMGMAHLRSVSLNNNRILDVPKWFYELTSLTCIRLNQNRIERISKLVRGMTRLTELSMRHNRIKQVFQCGLATISRLLKIVRLFGRIPSLYRALLQKRPIILRGLHIVATP